MRKIIGFIAAWAMFLTNLTVISAAEAEEMPMLIYACSDFEQQTEGEQPWGFFCQEGKESFSVENVPTQLRSDNKAMCLSYTEAAATPRTSWNLHYAPIADSFVLSLRFMNGDNGSTKRIVAETDATLPRNTLYLDTTGKAFDLMLVESGCLKILGQTAAIETEKWYSLDFQFDMQKKMLNAYLDGKQIVNGAYLPDTSVANIAGFNIFAPASEGRWYLDDFKIYVSPKRLSEDEFAVQRQKYQQSDIIPDAKYEQGRLYQYDKFVFLTLYNKFVARIDGSRFYKDNAYHKLSVPIRETDGILTAPIRDLAVVFGATISWEEDTGTITVIKDNQTLSFTVNSDIYSKNGKVSKMCSPVYIQEGSACAQLEALTSFFDIQWNRQGQLLVFGEELFCPYSLGVMERNQRGYTMEEEVLERIENSLIYERPNKKVLLETFTAFNQEKLHPRVLFNDFDMIAEGRKRDAAYDKLVEQIVAKGDGYLQVSPVEYTLTDGLRGSFPQQLYDRGLYLSFAYKMTGESKYKDKLWENLQAASEFPDFNPNHFLDVGNSANGIAIAYDWLYDDWTEEQRKIIEQMILDKLFAPAVKGYQSPLGANDTGFAYSIGNQPLIINNGFVGCALGMLDKYPEICSEVLACALRSVETCLGEFAPDGAWTEGVSYWKYTMGSLPFLIANFQYGLGDDFGILNTPGLQKTAYFPLGVSGSGGTFPMGDDAMVSPYDPSMTWFAKAYKDPALANMRKETLNGANVMDVLYWSFGTEEYEANGVNGDNYFRRMETVSMRTGWNKSDTVALLHGGRNNSNHGHIDNGSFQVDMLGERWACEVPKEEYNILYYGSYNYDPNAKPSPYKPKDYYRYKAEGHNTVIANLNASDPDQSVDAFAEIIKYSSNNAGSYAILDMTQTNRLYSCAVRGIKLDKYNNEVIIQDDFRAVQETEFWWFMTTQAEIELSADKKTAILSKNNKRVWVSILSGGEEEFQVLPAQSMVGYYTIPPVQGDNTGYRKLAIRKVTDKFQISVAMKPLFGTETEPAVKPIYQPMEKWYFEESEPARLTSVTVDGGELQEFDAKTFNYTLSVATEKSSVPLIEATAEDGCTMEILPAEAVPGVTSVLLKKNGQIVSNYNFIISPLNDTRKFLNDRQIPIVSYIATSEPEDQNPASGLFDSDLATKFATDEQGGAVTVDYGKTVELYEVMMAFTNGDARSDLFKLEVSVDGQNFTEVFNGGGNGKTKDYQSFIVGPVPARYLRVRFYGNSTGSGWASVAELCSFTQ